jgi:hypothetical protein
MIGGLGATNGHSTFRRAGVATLAASVGNGWGIAGGCHEDALPSQDESQQQNDGHFYKPRCHGL